MPEKICTKCHVSKSVEEFRTRDKIKGTTNAWCKACFSAYEKEKWKLCSKRRSGHIAHGKLRRTRNRQIIWDYLKSHSCMICGESDPIVLTFHHVGLKQHNISELGGEGCSIKKLMKEISQCKVLCANCHLRQTSEDYSWHKDIVK